LESIGSESVWSVIESFIRSVVHLQKNFETDKPQQFCVKVIKEAFQNHRDQDSYKTNEYLLSRKEQGSLSLLQDGTDNNQMVVTPPIGNTGPRKTSDNLEIQTFEVMTNESFFASGYVPAPPAPPLPPAFNLPPPPPPPPGLPGFNLLSRTLRSDSQLIRKLPQQLTPTPRAQMKKLQWNKIPNSRVVNSVNMWTALGQSCNGQQLNFDELETLFAINGYHVEGGNGEGGSGGLARDSPPLEVNTLERKKKTDEV